MARFLPRQILGLFKTAKGIIVWNYNSYNYFHSLLKITWLWLSTYFTVHHKQIPLSNCTRTGQICELQQPPRVAISWHIIYTFIPKARGIVVPFHNRCGILWNFCLFMVLWLLSFRKARMKKKGQNRCEPKQLWKREFGHDPEIRNGDLSQ